MMKAQLRNVTLLAVDEYPAMAIHAFNECLKHCDFGDVVLVTDAPTDFPCRIEPIGPRTWPNWYCEYCLKKMNSVVRTPFVLIVQWDGYVVNPAAWTRKFLDYDYIGAKWPWFLDGKNVGNSGFCLRSKRLLKVLSEIDYPSPVPLDDVFISRNIRNMLEIGGMGFAPEEIADQFAYERGPQVGSPFGFHGMYHMHKYVSDAEMVEMAPLFPDYIVAKAEYKELMKIYRRAGRLTPYHAMEKRYE